MKFIILTQYYPPEHGAPQNRLHDLTRRWVEWGHEVTVLTAMPNYPGGEVFPEYKGKFTCKEEIDGVKVVRAAIFASKKKSTLVQLTVFFSFVFSSMLVGLFRLKKADFLICESPPLFIGFSALFLSLVKRAKLVMNISDLWPESAVQLGILKPGFKLSILEWFEKLLYVKSAIITCQTDGIVAGARKRYPKANTLLFPNGVDLDMFPPVEKNAKFAEEFGVGTDHFVVGYGGNHGRSQALRQILDAAKIIQEKHQDSKIIFTIFGDGPEKPELMKAAEEMKLDSVRFFDSQPRDKMSGIQGLWDLAIVPLKNIDLFDGARPSKMFELMAGKVPFIFCGRGEGAEIAEESGCGMVVPPEDSEQLAEKIVDFSLKKPEEIKQMGEKGRQFVIENFNREQLAEKLLENLIQLNG